MKSEELINFLGYSIKSNELESLMIDLKMELNPLKNLDVNGDNYDVRSRNKEQSIVLSFFGYNRYSSQYGEPKGVIDIKSDELILTGIDFTEKIESSKRISLPFGLKFSESKKDALVKIKKKPKDISSTNYGTANWIEKDEFTIILALNHEDELVWLRILKHDQWELQKIKLRKDLSKQRKYIDPDKFEIVKSFESKLPTKKWKQRMEQGDNSFTNSNINQIESILIDYTKSLSEYTKLKKASNIFHSVKKVVSKINRVNQKNNHFIESQEREELCEFIEKIILSTGFILNKGIDLTEEWREW